MENEKTPRAPFLILALAVCILCGNLVSCQTEGDVPHQEEMLTSSSQTILYASTSKILDKVQEDLFRTQTVPLGKWRGRELSLELEEHRTEQAFQVDRICVLLDGELIQTLQAPEVLPQGADDPFRNWSEWPCYGLFDYAPDYEMGSPIVMDLNFDGYMDFGLMEGETPSRNIPYVFYLWDPEGERFDCFGTFNYTLKADSESRQLIEVDYGGNEGNDTNWYAWEEGRLVLIRREEEDWWSNPSDPPKLVERDGLFYETYPAHIYVRENGEMVQQEDEIRCYPAG